MHLGGARLDAGDETSSNPNSDGPVAAGENRVWASPAEERGETTYESAAARPLPSEIPPIA